MSTAGADEVKGAVPAVDSSTGPASRLMIRKMVLLNFKSYAGLKEVGPFHKCFSSVVGPNGSGKSNVIDALLFVFGRRAKQIRLNKLAELIHKSSEHPNLKECSVEVHFCRIIDTDEQDGYRVVPNSEFIISRRATAQSQSTYHIGSTTASFGEVADLLRTHGIDLDNNRFLILQGEVEQIALMKPKAANPHENGLLEFLEEIIGSNKYVEPIEEAFKQVEALGAQRSEKLGRVKMVEKEKDALEGSKQEAEEFLTKELQLCQKQSVMYQCHKHECEENVQKVEKLSAALNEKLEHEKEKIKEHTAKVKDMGESFKALTKECQAVEKAMEKAHNDFQSFERKDVKYREDIKFEKSKLKKARANVQKHTKKLETAEADMKKDQESLPQLEQRVAKLTALKEEEDQKLDSIFDSVKGKTEPFRVKLEAKSQEMVPLKQAVNECQQKIDVCEAELKLYAGKAESAKQKHADTKTELDSVSKQLVEEQKQIKGTTESLKANREKLAQTEQELESVVEREHSTGKKRQELMSKAEEAKASLAAAQSRSAVLDNLLKAKKKGILSGLQGRLGDLGAIDEKYDVAITTSCPSLDAIVVDSTNTGQRAVEFLRTHKLGRAKFVLLDQIQNLQARCDQKIDTPENVPRLFDLVRVKDKKFLPAFYWALRDTLVCETLDQAVRIAYDKSKRWRVVTLEGQLIDSSGTMSGGGKKVQRGGMSSHLRGETESVNVMGVSTLEHQVKHIETELASLRQRRKTLEDEVTRLQAAIRQDDVSLKKLTASVTSLKERHAELTARVEELEGSLSVSAEDKKHMSTLQKSLQSYQGSLEKSVRATELLQGEMDALERQIMDAGGAKLREQKARTEKVAADLAEANGAVTKVAVDAKTQARQVEAAQKAIAKTEKDIAAIEEKLKTLQDEFKQIEEDAVGVMEAYKTAESHLKEKNSEVKKIEKEYEAMKQTVAKIRSVEVDIQHQMDDYKRQLKENTAKTKHWAQKLEVVSQKMQERARELMPVDDQKLESGDNESVGPAAVDAEAKNDAESDGDVNEDKKESKEKDTTEQSDPIQNWQVVMMSPEEIAAVDMDEVRYSITMLEEALEHMKPNMSAIAEYRKKEREYISRVHQLDKVTEERDSARKIYDALRKKRLDEFMAGFSVITLRLKEMYQMLTLGGDAELELVDSLDPFSEGIVFSVRPPKKSWKNIQNLSGGEKTLSSLALVFALHHYKPNPLYVMDEIDAALDFKNVSIVANYIKERTKDAQFIIISLRNNMFELADRLVGIYKTHNATKSITIDPRNFAVNNENANKNAQQSSAPAQAKQIANEATEADPESINV